MRIITHGAFSLYFLFRLLIAINIKTFFQPDEFYQSLEPAHNLVFGYGYLTWEYTYGIRGISHALLYAMPYKILQVLGIDTPVIVQAVPKVLGALQAAVVDYYTVAFIHKYWKCTGKWAVVVTLLSAWNCFAMTRSFSNSLETALTAYALYKWPFDKFFALKTDELFYDYLETTIKALSAIGFAFLVRPTAILMWALPALMQLRTYKTTFLFEAIFVAYVAVQYSVILDSFYFGAITFPVWKFLRFNGSGSANFYGINEWHYYIVQGLPMLLVGFLPFFVHGLWTDLKSHSMFSSIAAFVLALYSLLGHKEVRFIMPLLPILHGYVASSISQVARPRSYFGKLSLAVMLILNISISYYATQVHQRGVMDLMQYIAQHREITELTLFMPCHSTPWLAHVHRKGNYRFLTCEPPLYMSRELQATYRDEADRFYDAPAEFLVQDLKENGMSEYAAVFQASQTDVESFWTSQGIEFKTEQRWFNSHFHDDKRRQGDVMLYHLESNHFGKD